MKTKNLKINLDAIKNRFSRMKCFVLAGTLIATMLTGCGKKESLLEGTILENTHVITFEDGTKDIAKPFDSCEMYSDDYGNSIHYKSVVTSDFYSDLSCTAVNPRGSMISHYPISKEESIVVYLTQEDIEKAMNNNLTDDDLITIVSRIMNPEEKSEEQTGEKSLGKK